MSNLSQKYFDLSGNQNVRNMLDLISKAEGTSEHGYNTEFGGNRFEDLSDHPRYLKPFKQTDGKVNHTSAAGKYQFLSNTWDEVRGKLGLTDFSGGNQDAGAIYLIERAGALDDVLQGDYKAAAGKLGKVWASLPSSPYPQPRRSEGFIEGIVNNFIPAANAGELPTNQRALPRATGKFSGEEMNNPNSPSIQDRISVNVNNNSPALPNALAAILGRYPGVLNAGGEFRAQDANQISPEAMQSIQGMREVKSRMLPVALGALMSSNRGANSFGQNTIGPAMSSLDLIKMQNGQLTPDGQYITDVDSSNLLRNMMTGMRSGANEGRTLSGGDINKFTTRLETFSQIKSLADTFKDDFTPTIPSEALGNAQNLVGKKVGLGYEKQGEFWMSYQNTINKIRNEMFGSALTETERAEFEKAIVRPGMKPDIIRNNLETQSRIIESALSRDIDVFKDSGYNTRGLETGVNNVRNPQVTNVENPNSTKPQPNAGQALSADDASLDDLLKQYGGR